MKQLENFIGRACQVVVHHGKRAAQFEKVRFMMVGIANTLTDFIVLLSLVTVWNVPSAVANIISTTCALIVSFSLNKKAVFPDSEPMTVHSIAIFIGVTLVGIWLVQTVIMSQLYEHLKEWLHVANTAHALALLVVAKIVGIAAGSIWNYMWYSRVIFKKKSI